MKGVMYHYVREHQDDLPYFTYLHVENFEKQLDYFIENYHVSTKEEFEHAVATGIPQKNSIVLTFDDGLVDHYQYVRPALAKRGLWGIFYVSTKPYVLGKLLDVHRVHYLLGHLGGDQLLKMVEPKIHDRMILQDRRGQFEQNTYTKQENHKSVTQVKQLFNYFLKPEFKEEILDVVMQEVVGDEKNLARKFYLSSEQIMEMIADGLSIGSHAHSHTLLSNLNDSQQTSEIIRSTEILRSLTQNKLFQSFCFPYGGKQSYNATTLNLLAQNGYTTAFSVESRPIQEDDFLLNKFELPRYDCNEFPYGKAIVGETA